MVLNNVLEEGEVTPRRFEGYPIPFLSELLGLVPADYNCGRCNRLHDVIIAVQDYPTVTCDYCHTRNVFPLVRKR